MDINGGVRRRRKIWPEALKREIIAAAFQPGASVSLVARQYDVNANQVFCWRKDFARRETVPVTPALVPVVIATDPGSSPPTGSEPETARSAPGQQGQFEGVELLHPDGWRARIGRDVDSGALRMILDRLTCR
jgi:transposase